MKCIKKRLRCSTRNIKKNQCFIGDDSSVYRGSLQKLLARLSVCQPRDAIVWTLYGALLVSNKTKPNEDQGRKIINGVLLAGLLFRANMVPDNIKSNLILPNFFAIQK